MPTIKKEMINLVYLIPLIISLTLSGWGCGPSIEDAKEAGFSSLEEMESFNKAGFSTMDDFKKTGFKDFGQYQNYSSVNILTYQDAIKKGKAAAKRLIFKDSKRWRGGMAVWRQGNLWIEINPDGSVSTSNVNDNATTYIRLEGRWTILEAGRGVSIKYSNCQYGNGFGQWNKMSCGEFNSSWIANFRSNRLRDPSCKSGSSCQPYREKPGL